MVRWLVLGASAAISAASPVLAEGPPATSNILLAKDVPVVPMAEWEVEQKGAAEQTGARILIAAGTDDTAKAPPNASRYDSQTFHFPHGDVRVLTFRKATGGVVHQITTETEIYVVKGSATVNVRGAPVEIVAGDVVNLPSGVLRSVPGKAEDTTIVAYTVANTTKDAKSAVVRGADLPTPVLAGGPKAGVGGATTAVKRYTFDGNSIRVAHLAGSGKTSPYTGNVDVLIYVASGHLRITVGDESREVSAGDVLCEEAGKPSFWEVLADSSFVATNSPAPETALNQGAAKR